MNVVFIDVERCIGCRHCEIACAIEHASGKNLETLLSDVYRPQPRVEVGLGIDLMTFPIKCQHCEPAPCMEACPTNAIFRDSKSGAVLIREEKCISCGMCAMVCPYNAISYKQGLIKQREIYKCDFCLERQDEGKEPACVNACVTQALVFGTWDDITSRRSSNLALKMTNVIRTNGHKEVPENLLMFRNIQEKIAHMGPLPSAKECEQ